VARSTSGNSLFGSNMRRPRDSSWKALAYRKSVPMTLIRQIMYRLLLPLVGLGIFFYLYLKLGPDVIHSLLKQTGWRFLGMLLICSERRSCASRRSCSCAGRQVFC
jgi:hypothetical protein